MNVEQVRPRKGAQKRIRDEGDSFFSFSAQRLRALCAAAGFDGHSMQQAEEVLSTSLSSWGHERIGRTPRYACDISDDYFPVEFSLALTGDEPEVRVLFEVPGETPDMSGRWTAAVGLNRRLQEEFGIHLGRLQLVEELFAPRDARCRYGMWHAVVLRRGEPPKFKLYLNPQARGKRCAVGLVQEAMHRLGFTPKAIEAVVPKREQDEVKFFCLDLSDAADSRVKVYKVHHEARLHDIERELCRAQDHQVGTFTRFLRKMSQSEGPYKGLPVSSYLSFTESDIRPSTGAVHFPVRDYGAHDGEVFERLFDMLSEKDRSIYQGCLTAFARRRLEDGVGMQSYVSLRQHRGLPRFTIYLSPEGYHVPAPSPAAARVRASVPARRDESIIANASLEEPKLEAAARDMGNLVRRNPCAVLAATCAEEVADMVRYCRSRGLSVAARGQGRTAFGQSLSNEMVIDLSSLTTVHSIETGKARVDAGLTWAELLRRTREKGQKPPVLTAFQGLSVGGTLSVGGFSGVSFRRGAQVDHVTGLRVVTGNGQLVHCSEHEHPHLFNAVLGGLGQCGIIVEADLELTQCFEKVRHSCLEFDDLPSFLRSVRALVRSEQLDGVSGTIFLDEMGCHYQLNAYTFFTDRETLIHEACLEAVRGAARSVTTEDFDESEYLYAVDGLVEQLDTAGLWKEWQRPWFDVFLPNRSLDDYLTTVLPTLRPADVGPSQYGSLGQMHLFPVWRKQLKRPLLRVPDDELVFLFDILSAIPEDAKRASSLVDRNRHLYHLAHERGGTQYPIAAIPMSRADWVRQLGPAYRQLCEQKQTHDPAYILNPQVGIF